MNHIIYIKMSNCPSCYQGIF